MRGGISTPLIALLWLAPSVDAAELAAPPARLQGRDLRPEGSLGLGTIEVSSDAAGVTAPVLELTAPPVGGLAYAIEGSVETQGVEGEGYLEMWSHFADGSAYFSRTLDSSGPLARLRGSEPARPFALPFSLVAEGPRPVRLVVNLVLPAQGRVWLRDLRFVNGERLGGAWWSDREAGLLGGVAGSFVGVLGALIGVLCSLGIGQRLALSLLYGMFGLGVGALGLGASALWLGQPYAVFYPPLLLGAVCATLPLGLLRTVRRRFGAFPPRGMRRLELG